ncbi:hypothetical protein KIY80_gp45 [Mycobacterium phage Benvolio]|uniref:Uncharacterized protein n=1 Tax=Mycobacterium phage Benvolio TaxID=2591074 RepID=A0A514A3M1_9CAUD|nr:hypothetical protein CH13_gp048 [Mycobacterium phage Echild]YP_010063482.1 hypothetical protein KIY80_gp45 [Mycobacterium phage Benvolio]AMW64306.1 hypothetical protein SEA_CHIPMUNK_50 [Mycobacterium phage ChipMunk]QKY78840.1 hypothetical protein KINGCYRUS_50 [Mycobacterium phage KingCyrus]AHG24269.1 hypothetical protein PBI_ECHILD_48 [Mycobacterium phage Echild]QDH47863.1 hypothetical protein SEA_BENVOLIO_45 [Mycobacterium phage Benvolio]
MGRRATVINLEDRFHVIAGEPVLDTQEGTLQIIHDDLTARVFNWDKVIDFYHMTEEETQSTFEDFGGSE